MKAQKNFLLLVFTIILCSYSYAQALPPPVPPPPPGVPFGPIEILLTALGGYAYKKFKTSKN